MEDMSWRVVISSEMFTCTSFYMWPQLTTGWQASNASLNRIPHSFLAKGSLSGFKLHGFRMSELSTHLTRKQNEGEKLVSLERLNLQNIVLFCAVFCFCFFFLFYFKKCKAQKMHHLRNLRENKIWNLKGMLISRNEKHIVSFVWQQQENIYTHIALKRVATKSESVVFTYLSSQFK